MRLLFNDVKNIWCVARHVKNIIKRLTLAKILCWTFRQLLLPSSAGMKNCKHAVRFFHFFIPAEEGNSSCRNVQHNILASVNLFIIFFTF